MAASRRPWLLPALLIGAAVVAFLAFGVFGVQTLFIDEEVSEAAPVFTSTESSTDNSASETSESEDGDPDGESAEGESAEGESTDEEDGTSDGEEVDDSSEEPAAVEPITVADGSFIDGAHPTTGTAVVLSDGGSRQVLRLEDDFVSDNGPDLNVYLTSSADGFGDEYIDLGDLKGNIGSQNYELPADVDLSLYDTVVIWCVRFGVGFGSAELGVA